MRRGGSREVAGVAVQVDRRAATENGNHAVAFPEWSQLSEPVQTPVLATPGCNHQADAGQGGAGQLRRRLAGDVDNGGHVVPAAAHVGDESTHHPGVDTVGRPRPAGLPRSGGGGLVRAAGFGQLTELVVEPGDIEHAPQLSGDLTTGARGGDRAFQRAPGRLRFPRSFLQAREGGGGVGGDLGQFEVAGQVECLAGPASRRVIAVPVGIGPCMQTRCLGPQLACRLCRYEPERLGSDVQHVDAGVSEQRGTGQRVQQPRPLRRRDVGTLTEPVRDQRHRAEDVTGGDRRNAGPHYQCHLVDALDLRRLVRARQQFQSNFVVAYRLNRAGHRHRLVPRLDARPDRGGHVVAGAGMPGQFGGRAGDLTSREGGGVRAVQSYPLPRQQVVVEGLRQQGMPERVAVGVHRHEHVALDDVPQGAVESNVVQPDHAGEQLMGDLPSGDRRGPHHEARGLGQRVQPDQQQVGEFGG